MCMPYSRNVQKAGRISFLLVCLFLCMGCSGKKVVFEAGNMPEEKTETIAEASKEEGKTKESVPENNLEDPQNSALVNINTADLEELTTLPGIGPARAADIIEYRRTMGEFEKIEDIMKVKGIKTGIFSKINSLICVK